jgi:hypothetical protein
MKGILIMLMLFAFAIPAFAQTETETARAVDGMIRLRSMMKDPNSFVLEAAYLLKPDKHGRSEICYLFNARNSLGGYGGTGEAFLNKKGGVYVVDSQMLQNIFWMMTDPCRSKNRVADLTADVRNTIDPTQTRIDNIQSPADRPKMIAAENATFKKDGVAGYAEIVNDTYTIHSERASSIRFRANVVDNKEYVAALQRAGITTLVYTNDADLKFVYDVQTNQIIQPVGAPGVEAATVPVATTPPAPASPQETPQEAQARAGRNTVVVSAPVQTELADAARRAKQHQACLKLAADNPSITCK